MLCKYLHNIGNDTSQFFANIYMNELDHYIKERLKVKYYVRSMDDFIMFVRTKEDAKKVLFDVSKYVMEVLY